MTLAGTETSMCLEPTILLAIAILGWGIAGCGNESAPWNGFPLFPSTDASVRDATSPEPAGPGFAGQEATRPPIAGAGNTGSTVPAAIASGGTVSMSANPKVMPVDAGTTSANPDPAGIPAAAPTTAFRIRELNLRDPHMFIGAIDVTEMPVVGMSINRSLIPNKLSIDADHDGFLDVSLLLLLQPLEALAANPTLTLLDGRCPADQSKPQSCVSTPQARSGAAWPVAYSATGTCLEPLPGSTSAYQPSITAPAAPCFVTSAANDLDIDIGGVAVHIIAARVSASYRLQPSPALVTGLIAGFVTSEAATRAILPAEAGAPLAGSPLSNYVRPQDYDLSTSPTIGSGFWIYLNFVGQRIDYTP